MRRIGVFIAAMVLIGGLAAAGWSSQANASPVKVTDKWSIEILATYSDLASIDRAGNPPDLQRITPVPTGEQYFAIRLRVTNTSDRAGKPLSDMEFGLVSGSGFEYGLGDQCGEVPDALPFNTQLDAGEQTEGVLCWIVRDKHVPTLALTVFHFHPIDTMVIPLTESGSPIASPST